MSTKQKLQGSHSRIYALVPRIALLTSKSIGCKNTISVRIPALFMSHVPSIVTSMFELRLSPSRASDFKICPQLYKFRAVDRRPEPPSPAAIKGSIVHLALQALFDLPASQRDLQAVTPLATTAWETTMAALSVQHAKEKLSGEEILFSSPDERTQARQEVLACIQNYFSLENPQNIEPSGRELRLSLPLGRISHQQYPKKKSRVSPLNAPINQKNQQSETKQHSENKPPGKRAPSRDTAPAKSPEKDRTNSETLENPGETSAENPIELTLVGVLDRVEQSPDKKWVISDYKTGQVPPANRVLSRFSAMQAYALLWQETFHSLPHQLRLIYLRSPSPQVIVYTPTPADLTATRRLLQALGQAILRARETRDWRPRPSGFCRVCSFHDICPAFTGDEKALQQTPSASSGSPSPLPRSFSPTPPHPPRHS